MKTLIVLMLVLVIGAIYVYGNTPNERHAVANEAPAEATPQLAVPSESFPPSFFGLHIHARYSRPAGFQFGQEPWPTIPFGSVRMWGTMTYWCDLESSKGHFNWGLFDTFVGMAQQHNVEILFTFGGVPTWASTRPGTSVWRTDNPNGECAYAPGGCYPPKDLKDWTDFVTEVVRHARGRIKYWELWNEANQPESWRGDTNTLLTMAQRAYEAIKSVDPSAIVLSPSWDGGPVRVANALDGYLAAGGGQYADAIAFHGYSGLEPESILNGLDLIQGVLKKHGQDEKPLWDTEGGWTTNARLPNEDDQTAFLARWYILQWSRGVKRAFWFAWNSRVSGTLWDPDRGVTRRPAIAYQGVYDWLVGATMMNRPWSENNIWRCAISRPGGYQAQIVWSSGGSRPYSVPAGYSQYRDLDGKVNLVPANRTVTIGPVPLLIENQPRH